MTREEAINIMSQMIKDEEGFLSDNTVEAHKMAIKALEQEPCEIIKEIPKDYKYDTETEDFLVYRHMYTGREIHIEKPVPRYRLEQEPCDDVTTFKEDVLDVISRIGLQKSDTKEVQAVAECLRAVEALSPDTAEPKMGYWIVLENWLDVGKRVKCSKCGQVFVTGDGVSRHYCSNCGQPKMEDLQKSCDNHRRI